MFKYMFNLKIAKMKDWHGGFHYIRFTNGEHLMWKPTTGEIWLVCFKCPYDFKEEK